MVSHQIGREIRESPTGITFGAQARSHESVLHVREQARSHESVLHVREQARSHESVLHVRESPEGISFRAQARSHSTAGDRGQARSYNGRICVIPNWADREAIRPVAAVDNPLRREWGLEGKFVVCYSGNMGRVHEFDTILGAAERLNGQAAGIGFLFIGGGAQRRMVEDEARGRALANVQFRPYQDRAGLSFSLGVGDVHLVSQRPEVEGYVFPSKLYGILAAGRPVVFIGEAQGEIGALVEREGIGVAVRQGDAAGLAEHLQRLAGDAALREAMGRRARAVVRALRQGHCAEGMVAGAGGVAGPGGNLMTERCSHAPHRRHSANTTCNVANATESVLGVTAPNLFASRVLSSVRTWSSKISPVLPSKVTGIRNGAALLPVVIGATTTVRR